MIAKYSNGNVALNMTFSVIVIDGCTTIAVTSSSLTTQTYNLIPGTITQSWSYPLFVFAGIATQSYCQSTLTYATNDTSYTYTITQGTLTLTPTFSDASTIG